jgi:hypothetical protein
VNQRWSEVQLVATTSTITVGCNFDVPNVFHRVYIYASAVCQNLVRDIFQASYRVRHLIDGHMVYHVDPRHFGERLPTDGMHIRTNLDVKERLMIGSMPTPPWTTTLRARNVQELNVSVMCLERLFQRYLRECNYVEELDATDILLHLDLHTSKPEPAQYGYDDIPQLYPDDVYSLIQKRIEGAITQQEEVQLAKYHFQQLVLDVSPSVKSILWNLFIQGGQVKSRNLSYERALRNSSTTLQAIRRGDRHAYRALVDTFSLQCALVQEITTTLSLAHSHDFTSQIGADQLQLLSSYLKNNEARIKTAFGLRFRRVSELNKGSARHAIEVVNQILHRWGFSSLHRQGRKRKRTAGVQSEDSVYCLRSKDQLLVNVYDHIRPASGHLA